MLKKFLAGALSVSMLFGMVSMLPEEIAERLDTAITASAYSVYGDYYYEILEDNTIKITEYKGSDSSITIPNEIYGKEVTIIGENAFQYNTSLVNVTIPDSVLSINSEAFDNCTNLASVIIPSSVENIGNWAFCSCNSLENIIIPDGVINIGSLSFAACIKLSSVTISSSVTSIGSYAFFGCESLKSVIVPYNVKNIYDGAFGYYYSQENNRDELLPGFKIICSPNSEAEQYATKNKIDYDYLAGTKKKISAKNVTNSLTDVFYTGTARKIDNYITVTDGNKKLVKGTDYTISYKNNIEVGINTASFTIKGTGKYTGEVTQFFTIKPKTMQKPTLSSTNNKLRVQWTQNTTNSGYQIYIDKTAYFNSASKQLITLSNPKQYASTISGAFKPGEKWFVKIRAYRKDANGKNIYGSWSTNSYTTIVLGSATFSSVTSTVEGKAVVRWSNVPSSSNGVQIQYTTKKDFSSDYKYASVNNITTLYKTLTKLVSGKTYYVRIRPYITYDGSYYFGTWSATKTVKVK